MSKSLDFKEFKSRSQQEWKEKVTLDLKGKPWPQPEKMNIQIDPFSNFKKSTKLKSKVQSTWKIGCGFTTSDPEILNQQILKMLALGVGHLEIRTNQILDEERTFNGIHKEMISFTEGVNDVVNLNDPDDYVSAFRRMSQEEVIRLEASKDFIANICFIRALRQCLGEDQQILLKPKYRDLNDDPDIALIERTMIGLAGSIGGADIIELNEFNHLDADQKDYNRIGTMIHHLMTYEASLAHVIDPLEGSYLVEELTDKIIQKLKAEPAL